MTEKDERFCDQWKWTRKRGKGWFIIRLTLTLGLSFAAVNLISLWGCECDSIFVKFSGVLLLKNILRAMLAYLIAFLLVGSITGWAIWNGNENRYKRLNGL